MQQVQQFVHQQGVDNWIQDYKPGLLHYCDRRSHTGWKVLACAQHTPIIPKTVGGKRNRKMVDPTCGVFFRYGPFKVAGSRQLDNGKMVNSYEPVNPNGIIDLEQKVLKNFPGHTSSNRITDRRDADGMLDGNNNRRRSRIPAFCHDELKAYCVAGKSSRQAWNLLRKIYRPPAGERHMSVR